MVDIQRTILTRSEMVFVRHHKNKGVGMGGGEGGKSSKKLFEEKPTLSQKPKIHKFLFYTKNTDFLFPRDFKGHTEQGKFVWSLRLK